MAKTAINIIKKWFKTGTKPTQDQFWSWQDSYWHKDEIIPQENIQNLNTTLSSKADADQLANKANADASGMTDLQAQAWATLLKPHLPTDGGSGSSTPIDAYTKNEINEKLGKITFRTIVDDNGSTYVPQPISFLQLGSDPDSNIGSPNGEIGMLNWNMYWGNYNKGNTGRFNLLLGVNNSTSNDGSNNTILGHYAFNLSKKGNDNVIIGMNAAPKLLAGYSLTLLGAGAGGNLSNEDRTLDDLKQISPVFEEYITGRIGLGESFGYDKKTGRLSSSNSVYVGYNVGNVFNGNTAGATTTIGSIWIGANAGGGVQYRDYNNVVVGNFFWAHGHLRLYNSVILGNHIDLKYNRDNVLAIHNSATKRCEVANALIYGEFDNRKLVINGSLTLNVKYVQEEANLDTAKALVIGTDGLIKSVPLSSIKGSGTLTPVPNAVNKLAGKKISVIGDSISNFGDTSSEYKTATGYSFDDIWVGQLLSMTGGIKGTIDARSGSLVQGNNDPHGFALKRSRVVDQESDYIFILMGANDQRLEQHPTTPRPLGEIKPKGSLGSITDASNPNFNTFTGAYQLALEDMLGHYKRANIVLMTPLKSFNAGSTDDMNKGSDRFAERVIELAKFYGVKWIDTRETGFNNYNHDLFYIDGLHPNKAGHKILAQLVVDKILEFGVVNGSGGGINGYTKAEVDTKLNDLTIGVGNLARNSAAPMFSPNSEGTGNAQVISDRTGYFVRYTPASGKSVGVYGFNMNAEEGIPNTNKGGYTISMDFRHAHTENVTIWGQSIPPNTWVRVKREGWTNETDWVGFNIPVPNLAVDVRYYKIERGTKATDWTPHISELKLGVSEHMIDNFFYWSDALSISRKGATGDELNTVLIRKIPNIDNIIEVQELTIIYNNGTFFRATNPNSQLITHNGVKHFAMPELAPTLTAKGGIKKVYIKALLK